MNGSMDGGAGDEHTKVMQSSGAAAPRFFGDLHSAGSHGPLQELVRVFSGGAFVDNCHTTVCSGFDALGLSIGSRDLCATQGSPSGFGHEENGGYLGGEESDGEDSEENADEECNTQQETTYHLVDPISIEDFVLGRDIDSGELKLGIDDTVEGDGYCQETSIESDDLIESGDEEIGGGLGSGVKGVPNVFSGEHLRSHKLGDCGCTSELIAQEIASTFTDGEQTGIKKRQRFATGSNPPDCRAPRSMGAVEIAMRTAGPGSNVFEPVKGMVFDSSEEAFEFYNLYSWEVGFGIIVSRCRGRKTDSSYRSMQEFACQRSGTEKRAKTATRKVGCKAKIRLLRTGDAGWYIAEFVGDHNHELSTGCCEKREWRSHKRIDPYTLDVIRHLRQNNVSATKVRCIIGSMYGGMKSSPCTKRSIRAICSQIAREQMDDDVVKTLELFKRMKAKDPGFKWSVERGPDGSIVSLMWCTGRSVQKYATFGDVVTFDTTYCTNFYRMPFGLFVGVNNHFQTTIFAGVLMKYETKKSFKWAFHEFIELMGLPPPQTVLTDQCKAMTVAVGEEWPDTFHLWCKWHVFKNIREHLGPTYTKNAAFRDEFYSIANEMLTKEEFVHAWTDLVERYKLKDNPFMIRAFQCRMKWAKPWAKGNFCAGMTSTQRSESANMMLKKFVPRNSSMNHFVSQYTMLLHDRDMEEGRQEHQTKQLDTKYTRMWPIERHAKKIYTSMTFNLFRQQVDKASSFIVTAKGVDSSSSSDCRDYYVVSHHNPSTKQSWYKKEYKVHVVGGGKRYVCQCGFFEHIGILCCHTLRLLILLDVATTPDAHIVTRWTREASDVAPLTLEDIEAHQQGSEPLTIWQARLNAKALEVVTKGNSCKETVRAVIKHIGFALEEVEEILKLRAGGESTDAGYDIVTDMETDAEAPSGNRYGAAGSSAGLSDSEILKLTAPSIERGRGRPRFKRFRSGAEIAMRKGKHQSDSRIPKKQAASRSENKRKTNGVKERKPEEPGKRVVLPYQSSFCTKCSKPGHTRNRCSSSGKSQKRSSVVEPGLYGGTKHLCARCGLKGHSDQDCLVAVDDDYFFK